MKKEVTAIIGVVLAVWFFFMGFELGVYKERKSNVQPSQPVVTTVPVPTASAPAPTEPGSTEPASIPQETEPASPSSEQSTAPSTDAAEPSEEASTSKKAADPSSMGTKEIVSEMSKAMKTLKAEQNLTAVKTEDVSIKLTDLSVSSLLNLVNNVIQNLAGTETITYTFSGGTATAVDGDGKAQDGTFTMAGIIPPADKEWSIDENGIQSASAKKSGENTVYEIKLKEEDTTYDSPIPPYSSTAYSYLDLTALDITGVTITDANMHYAGTTVTVTVDPSGKVTELHYNMPMSGYGEAKVTLFTGNASFEGYDDEIWTFTY